MSSHILKLWPFVLKRTLLQERTAGDWAMSNACAWLGRYRDDLKSARRENEELRETNTFLGEQERKLRADLKVAADTIVRLKGGACDHIWEAVHDHGMPGYASVARCAKCGLQPPVPVVA